jgi:hypothetical protein
MSLSLRFCTHCGADPLVGADPLPPMEWNQHPARCKKADEGVGRGPGGPPHSLTK